MQIQVKSSGGITVVPSESRLLSLRKVELFGEIDHARACAVFEQLTLLTEESAQEPIDLFVNSPGGEIEAGMLIYDLIQGCPAPVRTFCIGRAYSMAAVLFASGRDGRFLLPSSKLMLHEPLIERCAGGNATSIRSLSDSLMDARERMNRLLALHTGRRMDEIERETAYDHYFTAEQAVGFGLADRILTYREMIGAGT